jgi:putative transposase
LTHPYISFTAAIQATVHMEPFRNSKIDRLSVHYQIVLVENLGCKLTDKLTYMANTYTQIHIHAVFAVQRRECVIGETWKDELYRYIAGIIENNKHRLLAINGMPDHIHILFGFRPVQSLSDLMQDIKGNSSKWINERNFAKGRFSWQEGFGAFSYEKSALPGVVQYIVNQEEHHKKISFGQEYIDLLDQFEIQYEERFVFKPVVYSVPDGT